MHVMITLLFALSGAQAANDTADGSCSDWGDISQDDSIVDVVQAGDGEILLNVSSASCGETEECVWTLQGGTSQQAPGRIYNCGDAGEGGSTATGASICYLPPENLRDCRGFEFQVMLDCAEDDNGNDPSADAVRGELKDLTPECTVNASVSGGGCISAQGSGVVQSAVWLLFPLMGIGGWVRRRND